MSAKAKAFEDVQREFDRLFHENDTEALPYPPPTLQEDPHGFDRVASFDAIYVGGSSDREAAPRARRLFARWIVEVVHWEQEHGTKHTNYDEAVEHLLVILLAVNSKASRTPPPVVPEFCPHCACRLRDGVPAAQVEAQRKEQVEIEKELGLR